MKEKQDAMIAKFVHELTALHRKSIKAVWKLEVERTHDASLIVLIDNLSTDEAERKRIEADAARERKKLAREHGLKINTGFYVLSTYFEDVMRGNVSIFSEIKHSEALYDPTGFFKPLQSLVAEGRVLGTKEALLRFIYSVKRRLGVAEEMKVEALENLYAAVVNAGQAPLIAANQPIPVQKELAKSLRKHFMAKGMLSNEHIRQCEDVINAFKDFEHRKTSEISGRELDILIRKARLFVERMENLAAEAAHSKQ